MVQDLSRRRNADKSVTVYWKEPKVKGGKDLSYAITVNKRPLKFLNVTHYTIFPEESTVFYTVVVSFVLITEYTMCAFVDDWLL